MPIDEDLKLYEKLIDEKASTNSVDILPNAGKYHAAIAMSKLFDKTKDRVKMVVGSFDGEISDQGIYLKSLRDCLDRNVKFQILFLNTANKDSQAYSLLSQKKEDGGDITVGTARPDFINQLSKDGSPKHFAVYDDKMFRFEKDTKNYLALFSFNDKTIAQILSDIFDAEFQKLAPASAVI